MRSQMDALSARAQQAAALGNFRLAVQCQEEAVDLARALVAHHPQDLNYAGPLGGVLYLLAAYYMTTFADRSSDAAAALDEAEVQYKRILGKNPRAESYIADVLILRAGAQVLRGRGASALVDAQAAVLGYRKLVHRQGLVAHGRDLARVLALNADVLGAFGDPDFAVRSAEAAIELYGQVGWAVDEMNVSNFLRAQDVLVLLFEAQGRNDEAWSITQFLERTLRETPISTDSLGRRGKWTFNAGSLTLTCAGAVERARERLGPEHVPALLDEMTSPAKDQPGHVPLDRCFDVSMSAVFGRVLADVAIKLLPLEPASALRLGLEAHCLFAGGSQLQTMEMRYRLSENGPPWAPFLIVAARYFASNGNLPLALDLTSWARAVADGLRPFAFVDATLRSLVVDCLQVHGEMLTASGDPEAGAEALSAARNVCL